MVKTQTVSLSAILLSCKALPLPINLSPPEFLLGKEIQVYSLSLYSSSKVGLRSGWRSPVVGRCVSKYLVLQCTKVSLKRLGSSFRPCLDAIYWTCHTHLWGNLSRNSKWCIHRQKINVPASSSLVTQANGSTPGFVPQLLYFIIFLVIFLPAMVWGRLFAKCHLGVPGFPIHVAKPNVKTSRSLTFKDRDSIDGFRTVFSQL